jgi:hypothetical protein
MKKNPSAVGDATGLFGMVLMSVGTSMIYRPAGVILGGVLLVLLALFGFKPEKTEN